MDINPHNEIWTNIINIIGHRNIGVESALFQLFCPTPAHRIKAIYQLIRLQYFYL